MITNSRAKIRKLLDINYISDNINCLLITRNRLGRYARFVDYLAVRNFAQGAPLEGGSTLHYI